MNYSEWMFTKYPFLKRVSSAKAYQLISEAKTQTATLRVLLNLLLLITIASVVYLLGSMVNFEHYQMLGWYIGVFMTVLCSSLCSNEINKAIMKLKLNRLIKVYYGCMKECK